jgi:hypothetical protein
MTRPGHSPRMRPGRVAPWPGTPLLPTNGRSGCRCLHSDHIEVCEYVHGDLTITTWPDVDTATAHVDGLAAAWWEGTGRRPADRCPMDRARFHPARSMRTG